jgi:type II secretory pathway component GspD/PulD (secretin)
MIKLFFLLALVGISTSAKTEEVFKIFTLQHRFAQDLIPHIEPLIGTTGTVSGINNQLIVRTQAETMLQIESLVNTLDAARNNHLIQISFDDQTQQSTRRLDAQGNVKIGRTTIGNSRRANANDVRILVEDQEQNTQQYAQQQLRVLDGELAFIQYGQLIPYTQEWQIFAQQYTHRQNTTTWQAVTTGFAVRPRTIGNEIELEIVPRMQEASGQGRIDFTELSTIVRVKPHEWVDLGGILQNNHQLNRKILGSKNSAEGRQSSLQVRID